LRVFWSATIHKRIKIPARIFQRGFLNKLLERIIVKESTFQLPGALALG